MSFPNHRDHRTTRLFIITLLAVFQYLPFVSGGICWYEMDSYGYCKETWKYKTTKEECCSGSGSSTAFSPEDLQDDKFFILRTLGKGVPCTLCKQTCENIKCEKNKKCVLRDNKPVCVCAPKCNKLTYKKGPVCGTDGKTYKSVCRLKKQRCRTKNQLLRVNYYGPCQTSCKKVKCKRGLNCVQDQYMNAHCVNCSSSCALYDKMAKVPLCGDNGITYQNPCHIKYASCYSGRSITIAYRNNCRSDASCQNINCGPDQKCLVNRLTGLPRCVSCLNCREDIVSLGLNTVICGTNNQTYPSWCDMINDSCKKGHVIEALYAGSCKRSN